MNRIDETIQPTKISRHLIQQLLHEAIAASPDSCFGLLAGGENMLDSSFRVTHFVNNSNDIVTHPVINGTPCSVIYLSISESHGVNQARLKQLIAACDSGSAPRILLLDFAHAGRIDARLYGDPELTQELPFEMVES